MSHPPTAAGSRTPRAVRSHGRGGAAVLAIMISAVLSACGGDGGGIPTPAGGFPRTTDVGPVVPGEDRGPRVRPGLRAGREVFFSQGCAACHAVGSAGTGDLGGELTTVGAELSRAELESAVRRGPSFMPSYDAMPPEMVDELVDYLAALR